MNSRNWDYGYDFSDDDIEDFVRMKQADKKRARFRRKLERHMDNRQLKEKLRYFGEEA